MNLNSDLHPDPVLHLWHQYFHVWHLHNIAQLLQVDKLQTESVMSRFWQVAAFNLFHVLYDHYIVSASFTDHVYASQTQPECLSNFLFANLVVVVIDNDDNYSSSASHWVAVKNSELAVSLIHSWSQEIYSKQWLKDLENWAVLLNFDLGPVYYQLFLLMPYSDAFLVLLHCIITCMYHT